MCFCRSIVEIPGHVASLEKPVEFESLIPENTSHHPFPPSSTVRLSNITTYPVDIAPSAVSGATHSVARFSIIATQSLENVDEDQPIRYLDVVVEDPIEIDERLTLGRSLFGDQTADVIATIRGMKIFSAATYTSVNVVIMLGYVIVYLEMFLVTTDVSVYLRWIFACLFPLALFQLISSALRLVTKLVLRSLLSFDAIYLSSQVFLLELGLLYIYYKDVELVFLWAICFLVTLNTIFSDAMSEKSRQRTGGMLMLYSIVVNSFLIIVMKFSPDSAFHDSLELPGGKWLTNMGCHPIVINPIDFCIERLVTIIVFFLRFLYKQYKFPNAALNLNIPYVRRSA